MEYNMITKFKLYELNDTKRNREWLIERIRLILEYSTEHSYTSGDLEVDSDPVYYSTDETIALIDTYNIDGVDYTVYGGYKKETEIDNSSISYEQLDFQLLEEIKNILMGAVEYEMILINDEIEDEEVYKKILSMFNILNVDYDKEMFPDTFEEFMRKKNMKKYKI